MSLCDFQSNQLNVIYRESSFVSLKSNKHRFVILHIEPVPVFSDISFSDENSCLPLSEIEKYSNNTMITIIQKQKKLKVTL